MTLRILGMVRSILLFHGVFRLSLRFKRGNRRAHIVRLTSTMSLARNYVSSDVIRRVLVSYFHLKVKVCSTSIQKIKDEY